MTASVWLQQRLRGAFRALPLPRRHKRRLAAAVARVWPGLWQPPGIPRRLLLLAERAPIAAQPAALSATAPQHWLIIDRWLPTPDRMASGTRALRVLELLRSLGVTATFVSDTERCDYNGLLASPEPELRAYERRLAELGVPVLYGFEAALRALLEPGGCYRAVLLTWPEIATRYLPLVRSFAPDAAVYYDTVDLHSVRFRREGALLRSGALMARADLLLQMELANIENADVTIAASPTEQDEIRRQVPAAAVVVIPVLHDVIRDVAPLAARQGVLFLGQFLNPANEDAVHYFLEEVWPHVRRRLPDTWFRVVGSSGEEVLRQLTAPGVLCIGHVADPTRYFATSRVFVAPLRFGAGVKGKVSHSMSQGLPVVTTRVGAEGMGLSDGVDVLVADGAQQFAEAVVQLATDDELWQRISAGGLRWARAHGTPAATRPVLAALVARAGTDSVATPTGMGTAAERIDARLRQLERVRSARGLRVDPMTRALLRRARLATSTIAAPGWAPQPGPACTP
jgi:glycosyltransferase involved in cell wall biosynthesis